MPLRRFTTSSLAEVDGGRFAVALEQLVALAAGDCDDRPDDKKVRKVTIEIAMRPVYINQELRDIKVQFKSKCSVPQKQSSEISFGVRPGGALFFNPDSPADVNQASLYGDDD
jgi:hypothetical protein